MSNTCLCFVLLLLGLTSSWASDCRPDVNCMMPNCRCWNDPTPPGGLDSGEIPQMVLVSFAYGINSVNVKNYSALFNNLVNPNGCPARGTFFVQERYSSPSAITELYKQRHEIGVTTDSGTIPSNWADSFKAVVHFLESDSGITQSRINGTRAPDLSLGGDDQLNAMVPNNLTYDSSCVTDVYVYPNSMLWPYTYDFVDNTPKCTIGNVPHSSYKGLWEFIMPELDYNGTKCATPSACVPVLKNAEETFNFFVQNFISHYNYRRTPFIFEVNPDWLLTDFHVEGTTRFLQYIRAGYKDTWVITFQQALDWIMDPVSTKRAKSYIPWGC